MAQNNQQTGPAIAPQFLILICIAVAVVAVVMVAALYRLCRRANAEAKEDVEVQNWNPNKRNREQDEYMEEVRWRNNASAWEHAREVKQGQKEYRRCWFKGHIDVQRAKEQAGWTPVSLKGSNEDVVCVYNASILSKSRLGSGLKLCASVKSCLGKNSQPMCMTTRIRNCLTNG